MTMEELLGYPNPEVYDFKGEHKSENYNIEKMDSNLKRFFHYKVDSPKQFDADSSGTNPKYVSALLREIYEELFLWNDKHVCEKRGKTEYLQYGYIDGIAGILWGPDTMNTFMTATLPQFLCDTELLSDYKKHEPRQQFISSNMLYQVICKDVLNKTDTSVGGKFGLKPYLSENEYTAWEQLAGLIHTLGNFVLVPAGFNQFRAKHFDDYWDTSLQYLSINPWASAGFLNWYINHFFLWDYVDKVGNTYRVKSLYSPTFFAEKKLQKWYLDGQVQYSKHTKDEINVWIENVVSLIQRRGILMVALLKLKLKDKNRYNSLLECFNSNEAIGSMDVIIEMIKKQNAEIGDELSKRFEQKDHKR